MADHTIEPTSATDVAELDHAFEKIANAITNDPDPDQAFKRATELVETLRRLYKAAGDLRASSAARIWETEELTLAILAERIGVSKARAAQLIKAAETQALKIAIAVVVKGSDVLLVCRREDSEEISWQFPAGIVKPRMTAATIAVRETLAETGIHCKVKRYLGSRVHPITNVLCDYFLCSYLTGKVENKDPEENINVTWAPIDQLTNFIPLDRIYPPIIKALEEYQ